MDYQRNGWYRPTCGVNRAPNMRPQQAPHTASADKECCDDYPHIQPTSLAMVCSPVQTFVKIYEPAKALSRGTLFAELDKPFTGKC